MLSYLTFFQDKDSGKNPIFLLESSLFQKTSFMNFLIIFIKHSNNIKNHLSSILDNATDLFYFFVLLGKVFQNLSVSSPAPVTIVSPDGFIAKKRTRLE